jgi:hypothetical protein
MADSTPAPGDGGDIIIKGGSCEIHFDDGVFKKDDSDPRKTKHKHDVLKIRRIVITGDAKFDEAFSDGFTGEIRISCKP